MHNNIMVVGSRDCSLMLAPGRYPQWRSRFLRYVDTRPNGEALRKCILSGPYKPTTVLVQAVEATDDSPAVPEHTTVETPTNMSPENKAHFLAEKEAIHLILTGIGDNIYSTVDARQTAQETNANPLALVATAQADRDPYYETSRSQRSSAPSSKPSIPSRSHTSTRHKGKDIAKLITTPSETAFEEDNDPEQAQRDRICKRIWLLLQNTSRRSINPPTTTSKHPQTPRTKTAREKVGSPVVQQSGIQCFNYREFRHFAKECKKPKRVKDSAYHKEKMLLCKQAEQDSGTDSEQVEQVQNDVGYNVFANCLQHSEQSESVSNTCLVETYDRNVIPDSPDMCEDDIQNEQNDVKTDDERVALANLTANLKLDTKQTEFEKYKAFNDHTTDYDKLEHKLNEALGQLAHKDTVIREGLKTNAYELSVVKEKHNELMKQSLLTKLHYEGLIKQKMKVITDLKLREEHDIEIMLSMEKQLKFLNEVVYKISQSIQTIHMMAPKVSTYNGKPTFFNPRYIKQAQSEIPCLYAFPYDQSTHANRLIPNGEETLALERESRSKLNKDSVRPYDYTKLSSLYEIFKPPTQEYETQLAYVKECDCFAQKLSKQTESVSKKVHTELLQRYAKVEKHSIYLEIALQKCKEQNIAISDLKKLIEKGKGKSVDTKFERPSVVRQPNAQRIPKPLVLGKPTPFSNSLDRIYFPKTKSVPKTNVSEGLSKPVTSQTLPQTA
nr:hypothetical protein [Tanacetum cinerariifolium]